MDLEPTSLPLPASVPLQLRPLRHLVRAVWLQALRRNEFYVVAILLGLYVLGGVIVRIVGIESAQTARFITGLGLELGGALATLLVILMGARAMPEEMEQRTLYPILAKPVSRSQILFGKALPTWALGVFAMVLFTVATLAITPRLGYQHSWPLAQALLLKALALAGLTALSLALSLLMPTALAMVLAVATALMGSSVANMIVQAGNGHGVVRAIAALIPDFSLLSQFGRYVDGGAPLSLAMLGGLIGYGVLWTVLLASLAVWQFSRKPL